MDHKTNPNVNSLVWKRGCLGLEEKFNLFDEILSPHVQSRDLVQPVVDAMQWMWVRVSILKHEIWENIWGRLVSSKYFGILGSQWRYNSPFFWAAQSIENVYYFVKLTLLDFLLIPSIMMCLYFRQQNTFSDWVTKIYDNGIKINQEFMFHFWKTVTRCYCRRNVW